MTSLVCPECRELVKLLRLPQAAEAARIPSAARPSSLRLHDATP